MWIGILSPPFPTFLVAPVLHANRITGIEPDLYIVARFITTNSAFAQIRVDQQGAHFGGVNVD